MHLVLSLIYIDHILNDFIDLQNHLNKRFLSLQAVCFFTGFQELIVMLKSLKSGPRLQNFFHAPLSSD